MGKEIVVIDSELAITIELLEKGVRIDESHGKRISAFLESVARQLRADLGPLSLLLSQLWARLDIPITEDDSVPVTVEKMVGQFLEDNPDLKVKWGIMRTTICK